MISERSDGTAVGTEVVGGEELALCAFFSLGEAASREERVTRGVHIDYKPLFRVRYKRVS